MDQSKNKKKILVTGVGGPAGISIVKLLKASKEFEVFGCDIDITAAGQNYVDTFLISPRVTDTEEYKKWMKDIAKKHEFSLIIPTVDEELLPLSLFVNEIDVNFLMSESATLEIASDKLRSYDFMFKHIPQFCPRFTSLSDWTEDWSEDKVFFIKPRNGRGARGCKLVPRKELKWMKDNSSEVNDVVVMENLPGDEWTVDAYISKNGKVVYSVPRERMALSGGISIKGKTVKNDEVVHATNLLLDELKCVGPVCVQWKADSKGIPKFVEINPRLSGGLMISVNAGVDPVEVLLNDLCGKDQPAQDWKEVTSVGHIDYQIIKS